MAVIKSSSEHLTLNADGAGKDIKFQANGVEKASISSAGAFTSTSIDATKLSGALPAIDGSALTGNVGKVLQVTTPTVVQGATSYSVACVQLISTIYYPDAMKLSNTITKLSATSDLIVTYKYNVDYEGASGVHNFLVWKDSSNFHLDGNNLHDVSATQPMAVTGSVIFKSLGAGSHTFNCAPARGNTATVGLRLNASADADITYVQSYIYIMEVET